MSKLKASINKAITITPDGQPHSVNMPELKKVLMAINDNIEYLKIILGRLMKEGDSGKD
jgi:hypothetical protein